MPRKSKHTGTVTDNNDPDMQGRLTVECPTIVTGDVLEWIDPKFPFTDSGMLAGWFFVPNIGAQVEVEIEEEEDSEVQGLEPKWQCTLYPDGTVPVEFRIPGEYPNIRGWKTAAGHLLIMNDTEAKLEFKYIHPTGSEIYVTNTGQIELKPIAGQSVFIGEAADQPIPLGTLLKALLTGMKTAYDTHTHSSPAGGSTGTPSAIFPTVDDSILSTLHKVK